MLSVLVRSYMKKTKDIHRGYWGNEGLKPEFWPEALSFRGPSSNTAITVPPLKVDEIDRVLQSYEAWSQNVQCLEELHVNFEIAADGGAPAPTYDDQTDATTVMDEEVPNVTVVEGERDASSGSESSMEEKIMSKLEQKFVKMMASVIKANEAKYSKQDSSPKDSSQRQDNSQRRQFTSEVTISYSLFWLQ